MVLTEIKGDLFEKADSRNFYVQCISADFVMGGGIALKFNEVFNTKEETQKKYPNYFTSWERGERDCDCLQVNNVFNLVTKRNVYDVPSLQSIEGALILLKHQLKALGVKKISMPKIGCGIDQQNWETVSQIIMKVFNDEDLFIDVYYLWGGKCL